MKKHLVVLRKRDRHELNTGKVRGRYLTEGRDVTGEAAGKGQCQTSKSDTRTSVERMRQEHLG